MTDSKERNKMIFVLFSVVKNEEIEGSTDYLFKVISQLKSLNLLNTNISKRTIKKLTEEKLIEEKESTSKPGYPFILTKRGAEVAEELLQEVKIQSTRKGI